MLELFLGQIPEAIFFALFMLYAKNIKEKRVLFVALMITEYLLLKYFIKFSIIFQITYTCMTYLIIKVLYKEKSQITDIFTYTISSIVLLITCVIMSVPSIIGLCSQTVCVIFNRIAIFVILFIFKNKLYKIQKLYKKIWNRNDKVNKKIKSTTFRAINVIIFNISFYLINICILFAIYYNKFSK